MEKENAEMAEMEKESTQNKNVGKENAKKEIPVHEKFIITAIEAATLTSGLGEGAIRRMMKSPECPFRIVHGNMTLVKVKEFQDYISKVDSI